MELIQTKLPFYNFGVGSCSIKRTNNSVLEKEFSNSSNVKTCKINNKRYLGNKYKLLDFIKYVIKKECKDVNTIADIFAGTGAVSSAFTDKKLIVNDILYSNYICHIAWFSKQDFSVEKIEEYIRYYNSLSINEENYMSKNFADTFFSASTCRKIGFIREDIDKNFSNNLINEKERAILITSLLYSMDKIANTCGHYDAYRKKGTFDKQLELVMPTPEQDLQDNKIFNMDANELVKNLEPVDIVYIDPPYNSRQYCDAYHLLENVAKWEKPEVFGVAKKMNRDNLKSAYCTSSATKAFEDLIKNIKARYILLSYNNMEQKGNERSNARISDSDILRILKEKGKVKVFSKKYKAFSTGKSNIQDNEERLFFCECFSTETELIQSPLNYIGGKFKLLEQILPKFPKKIDTFVDLFCGGCNVGININAKKIIFNDLDSHLIGLYNVLKNCDKKEIFETITSFIKKYNLSESFKFGYNYYSCTSDNGLQEYNKLPFKNLRTDFNSRRIKDTKYYLMLYTLIIYSFNNQLRFNSNGEFNLPVGKRDFNSCMQTKLNVFIDRLKKYNIELSCKDFREINIEKYGKNSFVYIDPPYLITCATYNEKDGWKNEDELDLLNYIDNLHSKGIKFALSNVLTNKGKSNKLLLDWIKRNNYKIHYLDYSYKNSNYQTKDKITKPQEVLITNY